MKYFLQTLLFSTVLIACPSPYAQVNVCELMPQASKDAEAIWEKTKDSDSALDKLEQGGIIQVVMYGRHNKRLPKCKTYDTFFGVDV